MDPRSLYIYNLNTTAHLHRTLVGLSCMEAAYFKFCTDIPCSMDKKIINFVFSRNFIWKKKCHLFVAHHCKFRNQFSLAGVPFSWYDHIIAYPSH